MRQALQRGAFPSPPVVFVDLVGSTSMAAERPPQEVVGKLNDFFGVVVEVVKDCGGWGEASSWEASAGRIGSTRPMPMKATTQRRRRLRQPGAARSRALLPGEPGERRQGGGQR